MKFFFLIDFDEKLHNIDYLPLQQQIMQRNTRIPPVNLLKTEEKDVHSRKQIFNKISQM